MGDRVRRELSLAAGAILVLWAIATPREAEAGLAPSDRCYWFTVHWVEMSPMQQELMGRLGWNAKNWDSEDTADDPPNETEYWDDLTDEERQINEQLGLTRDRWDNPPEDCKST